MSEFICEAGPNLEMWRVNINDLREQDVNAQYMIPEMFNRLSQNIKREDRLESVPFAVKREKHFELISGHHRVRAARSAGLTEIIVLADTRDLNRSQVVAKQIAHNRLTGESSEEILARMIKEIQDVDDMIEAYVDMKELGVDPPGVDIDSLALSIDWRIVTFAFLPAQMEKFKEVADEIPESDFVGVVNQELFEDLKNTLIQLKKAEDIRSIGALVGRMLEITDDHLKTLKQKSEHEN